MNTCFIILIFLSLLSSSEIKSIANATLDHGSVWRTDEEVMAIYEEWMAKHGKSYNALEKRRNLKDLKYLRIILNISRNTRVFQIKLTNSWAFSAIASVEALKKIEGRDLISLSEQMLVDCVTSNYGCKGGRLMDAFRYITRHGIASSQDYPYQATNGSCQNKKIVFQIKGYRRVPPKMEKFLQVRTSKQVVSVRIKAKSEDIQHYSSGIFSGKCGVKVNHDVNIVGYDSENGKDFWIVRYSWGKNWGEEGYMRMPRNIKNSEGYCGIALWPMFPVIYDPLYRPRKF